MYKKRGPKPKDRTYDRNMTVVLRQEMADTIDEYCKQNDISSYSIFIREAVIEFLDQRGINTANFE
jgi:metal-responsive CopG/Arc/MetJ family transcriptional regulator